MQERAELSPQQLTERFAAVGPRAARARRRTRHRAPCRLELTGVAGGSWTFGDGGPTIELDAIEFCRTLSRRGHATGLLATEVPF